MSVNDTSYSIGNRLICIITLNESALLLWNSLLGREFTAKDAADVLIESYDVEAATALRDAQLWIDKLSECKLLD